MDGVGGFMKRAIDGTLSFNPMRLFATPSSFWNTCQNHMFNWVCMPEKTSRHWLLCCVSGALPWLASLGCQRSTSSMPPKWMIKWWKWRLSHPNSGTRMGLSHPHIAFVYFCIEPWFNSFEHLFLFFRCTFVLAMCICLLCLFSLLLV